LNAGVGSEKGEKMTNDEIYMVIYDTNNMLIGMTRSNEIPQHVKGDIQVKIKRLEETMEKMEPDLGA